MTPVDRRKGSRGEGEAGPEGDDPPPGADLPRRIVLVGFMATGKTTVGRLLARRLGYGFVDLDGEVERRAGRSIPDIFGEEGEARFRELEAEATRTLDPPSAPGGEAEGLVVAAGGGWMARPELRDRWEDAVRVWLRAEPRTVIRRVGEDVAARPMLDPEDPLGSARRLLAEREEAYGRAEVSVATDTLSPEEVAGRVLDELRAGTP